MAFINNAHPGSQINILCLIFRILSESSNKFTVEDIQEYCAPSSLFKNDDHKKRFRENLNFWLEEPHRLWKLDENKMLMLDLPCEYVGNNPKDIAHQLRHRLMKIRIDDILSESDFYGVTKGIRSFAYILTQDNFCVFSEDFSKENVDKSFAKNFSRFSLNDSEKSYFIEFCNFLGISEASAQGYYIDPTRLVESFLPDIFLEKNSMPALDFIKELGRLVPIVDNGVYNLKIREFIGAEVDLPNSLSKNLSHALKRISEKQMISFSSKSDDIYAVKLNLPDGKDEYVSMVSFQGGKK